MPHHAEKLWHFESQKTVSEFALDAGETNGFAAFGCAALRGADGAARRPYRKLGRCQPKDASLFQRHNPAFARKILLVEQGMW
jgi:hypothetical protein